MSDERNAYQEDDYAWCRDGSLPHARHDRIAEAIAMGALIFALFVGLAIAVLPVGARAASTAVHDVQDVRAGTPTPSLELAAFKIVPALPGQPEQLVAASEARAGDRLEYRAVYRNPTAAVLHHVMVTLPVPADGVEYLIDTAKPRADLASNDGKTFSALPLMRVEAAADGGKVSHPAPGADYRFLRWNLGDVPAGAERTVSTRVQLLATNVSGSAGGR